MSPRPPALSVSGLTAGYKGQPIIHGLSFSVSPGEVVAVVGPNGAGKSTCVKAIAGLVPRLGGTVRLGDRDLAADPVAAASRGLAFVPQERNIFRGLSVAENLAVAAWGRADVRVRRERVLELLPELHSHLPVRAAGLSGGQRQMLAVAMALMGDPPVLMADEPCAGLSPLLRTRVLDILRAVAADGRAVLVVEQNVRAVLAKADRAIVLVAGRVHWIGGAAELASDPQVASLFFGTAAPSPSPTKTGERGAA